MNQSILRKLRRKKTQEGIKAGTVAPVKRSLNAMELLELQEIDRIARTRAFEANQIKSNTALMPARWSFWGGGNKTELVAELEAIARLMTDIRSQRVQSLVAACGYPPDTLCDINLTTGAITIPKNEA